MSDGMRDAFIENDVLGNSNANTVNLFGGGNRRRKETDRKSRKSPQHRRKTIKSNNNRPKFGSKAWFKKYKPQSHRRKKRKK